MNKPLKILVACEESGRTTLELRKYGYEAFSCDIIDSSYPEKQFHIKQDVTPLLNGNCHFKTMDGTEHYIEGKWDLIIAHPPCTYFCIASAVQLFRGGILNQKRFEEGQKYKDFFLMIYNADCEFICIENPTPLKVWKLPKHSQVIQPWMFDDDGSGFGSQCEYSKRTCLWLKNLPNLKPMFKTEPDKVKNFVYCRRNKGYIAPAKNPKERSKTFKGIARAFVQFAEYVEDVLTKRESEEK